MTTTRRGLVAACAYLFIAVALSGTRPLWLDEVLQLLLTGHHSTREMVMSLPQDVGSVPLGYIVQQVSLKITGFSSRRARLPASVFGAAAVFVIILLGNELGLAHPISGAALFGSFPLVLRYAAEGRPYSQGLFFSLLATLIYVKFAKRPAWPAATVYWLVLLASIYSQPYSYLVAPAHIIWSALNRARKATILGGAAMLLACIGFLPWYVWSKAQWLEGMKANQWNYSWSAKTPLVILREFAGAGYIGTGGLLILIGIAVIGRRFQTHELRLLVLVMVIPLAGALAIDAWFGYFIAARQFIWSLPAAAILAVGAIERRTPITIMLAGLIGIACCWSSVSFFTRPHEDWAAAANAIAEQVQQGACLATVPGGDANLFEFFRPELRSAHCSGSRRVILATSPYTGVAMRGAAIARLASAGYGRENGLDVGKCHIEIFSR
jgi:4-amino-4-deoxy-L-arabinose transferase-like glycosyltransferase